MAKNFSFTSEGMAEFGSSPNAYFTPNPPKYQTPFLLPVLAGGILDLFPNTSAYTDEAIAIKVLEEGGPFYSQGSNIEEQIEQQITQLSAGYILEILSDGGPFVDGSENAEKMLSDINVALDKLKNVEDGAVKRAAEIGIDAAEDEITVRAPYANSWIAMVEQITLTD